MLAHNDNAIMGGVADCSAFFGECELFERDPSLLHYRNAIYIPANNSNAMGLYDIGRRVITSGSYLQGPHLTVPASVSSIKFSDVEDECASLPILYAGYLHHHFGHFLLSTFCRFWPFAAHIIDRSLKIAVHTSEPGAAQYFYARPWAKQLLAGIGLGEANFITFDRPTRLREVIVPAPSFEEGSFVHHVFAKLCNMAGANLCATIAKGEDGPAYLSKQKLTAGVRKIENEDEVVAFLDRRGIAILYPETLPISGQAAMWRDRSAVASIVSSGLHGAILAPGRAVVAVSDSAAIQSSFALIDRVNGAKSRYLGLEQNQLVHTKADPSFQVTTRLVNPVGVAEAILRAIESLR